MKEMEDKVKIVRAIPEDMEYFYVSEQDICKGFGKQMWDHMTNWCREQKIRKIHFVT